MPDGSALIIGKTDTETGTTHLARSNPNLVADPALIIRNDFGTGIRAEGYGLNGYGVQSHSMITSAVYGTSVSGEGVYGSSQNSFGVRGEGNNLPGVWGSGYASAGVYGRSSQSHGVFGEVDQVVMAGRPAPGGPMRRAGVSGLAGNNIGTAGQTENSIGVMGELLPPRSGDGETPSVSGIGVLGRAHPSGSEGVLGLTTNGVGVAGVSRGSGFAGGFEGDVFVRGSVFITGLKSAAVPHSDGSHRVLYALESPESWFEDFGRTELVEGQAQVELDPDFAAVAHTEGEDYHVFLTPEGPSNGLYLSNMGPGSFEVREQQDGSSSLSFSYRVVAKRKDIQGERFEPAHLPPPVADDEILDTVIQETTIEDPRRGEQPQPPGQERR